MQTKKPNQKKKRKKLHDANGELLYPHARVKVKVLDGKSVSAEVIAFSSNNKVRVQFFTGSTLYVYPDQVTLDKYYTPKTM